MKTVIHKSETRGHANHGWLDTWHTFSFSSYYNPERMSFGVLRVLNDDTILGGTGFGTHPHQNMEIISIPLSGDLEHKDSMGTVQVIMQDDVQVMSAGTGITHSEYNHSKEKSTNFLQIWVIPSKLNVAPRYEQKHFPADSRKNKLTPIVVPFGETGGVQIHQDAWFYRGSFDAGQSIQYKTNTSGNGIYVFVIEGEAEIEDSILKKRDGAGITNTSEIEIKLLTSSDLLVMEVPMSTN
jgi:redox-sensitive bicupin YhaK (pirin superfamily)